MCQTQVIGMGAKSLNLKGQALEKSTPYAKEQKITCLKR
jgi:hypothetical protein